MNPLRHPRAPRRPNTRRRHTCRNVTGLRLSYLRTPRLCSQRLHSPRLGSLALLLFALVAVSQLAPAQTPQPTPPADEEVINVRTDLILVRLYVTDARGRRVSGLARDDFRVFDNGRPVALDYFAPGTSRSAFVFALDASGSVRENIARQREAATALLSRFGAGARAAVLVFSDRPALALPFTTDAARVRAAFQIDAQPERRTAIFDAALAAVRGFDTTQQDAAERRIVVLLSDGLDNVSSTRPSTVIDEARARGVSIYVVHFPLYAPSGEHLAVRPPAHGFRDLAERTGGAYFLLADPSRGLDPHFSYDLNPVFTAIADDLHSQYELGFYPDDNARHEPAHKLEITMTDERNRRLRVRALRDTYTLKP
jgi:Ca-activated chloride channel homolog